MTHQRTLTAAHWGVYEVEYDDSRQGHAPASFLQGSRSLADRPAHAVRRGDAAARAPAGRAQELARAGPRRQCRAARPGTVRRAAVGRGARSRRPGAGAREEHALQPRDLRRLLRLVERRPLPSRAEPGPSLPEFDRRLRAPPGFLQPGRGTRADAAHRGADGRADVHAHAAGTCWPSTASCSSPSAACRTRTRRSTPAAPPCITSRAASTRMREKGVRFVNVTPTAEDLDTGGAVEWLAIRPNTDAALILALCHTLWTEKLYDRDFLDRCTVGFDKFAPSLAGKDAAWAEKITGIPASRIVALAREMAATRTTVSIDWSLQRSHHGEQPFWALVTLACMLGQIGLPGGGFGVGYGPVNLMGSAHPKYSGPTLPQGTNAVQRLHPGRALHRHAAQSRRQDRLQRPRHRLSRHPAGLLGGRQSVPSPPGPQPAAGWRGASPRRSCSTSSSGRRPRAWPTSCCRPPPASSATTSATAAASRS